MNEAETRKMFAGERAEALVKVVEHGWRMMVQEERPRGRRTRANIVWDYTVEAAETSIEPLEGVHRIVRHKIPMFVFDSRVIVRFKKHNREFLYSNVPTRHQRQIAQQLSLNGLPPEYLTCGYVLDKAESDIEKVVLCRHIRRQLDWVIDLRELAAGELKPVRPVLPLAPTGGAPGLPTIRPAAREGEDGE